MSFLYKLAFACLAVVGIVSCNQTDWWQGIEREREAERRDRGAPRVIAQSADGCYVYTFQAGGDWHYFTRCGSTVTTDRNYSVPCGKARCSRVESITTHTGREMP